MLAERGEQAGAELYVGGFRRPGRRDVECVHPVRVEEVVDRDHRARQQRCVQDLLPGDTEALAEPEPELGMAGRLPFRVPRLLDQLVQNHPTVGVVGRIVGAVREPLRHRHRHRGEPRVELGHPRLDQRARNLAAFEPGEERMGLERVVRQLVPRELVSELRALETDPGSLGHCRAERAPVFGRRGFAVNLRGYRGAPRSGAVSSSTGDVPLVPPFGPLSGVRILESARFVAGPWAATYLGEFGARVIHVEGPPFEPPYADPTRTLRPVLEGSVPGEAVSESWVQCLGTSCRSGSTPAVPRAGSSS